MNEDNKNPVPDIPNQTWEVVKSKDVFPLTDRQIETLKKYRAYVDKWWLTLNVGKKNTKIMTLRLLLVDESAMVMRKINTYNNEKADRERQMVARYSSLFE